MTDKTLDEVIDEALANGQDPYLAGIDFKNRMTDKETSLAFVERMEATCAAAGMDDDPDSQRFIALAKTAALIEEHRLRLEPSGHSPDYRVISVAINHAHHGELHQAVRAVADKIKEGK